MKKPAHGRYFVYPAQLNPPPEPQLLALETPIPAEEIPREAIVEIFLRVSWLWQVGQTGFWFASEKRTIFSNSLPHSLHSYSYKGIVAHLSYRVEYTIPQYSIVGSGMSRGNQTENWRDNSIFIRIFTSLSTKSEP